MTVTFGETLKVCGAAVLQRPHTMCKLYTAGNTLFMLNSVGTITFVW